MVKSVVGLGSELKPTALSDWKRLEKAEIPVEETGLVDKVADALGVERALGRLGKDRRSIRVGCSEPLIGILRAIGGKLTQDFWSAIDHPELAAGAPKVRILAHTGVVITVCDTTRRAGLELVDAADLPSAQKLS